MSDLQAVITGGSSGLGLELAVRLASRGTHTTLVARDPERLEEAAATVRKAARSAEVRTSAVDVSDRAALARAFAGITAEAGGIDLLINSAGIAREGYFEHLAAADFREVMDVNFFGVYNAVRAALPELKARRGRIVNIASVAGLIGAFGYTPYCAAKHALVGFSEALRHELRPQGVRVQLVCPGEFDSPMVEALNRSRTPENRAHASLLPKLGLDQVARETLRGIDRDRDLIIPGARTRLLVTAQRFFPGIGRRIAGHRIGTVYRGPEHDPRPGEAP
ncbi:SDR family NAD(P)-dependent oxidoreductase [Amycolatopsis nigrescens]|uniref:SDR family NAD(P)-dependent oxidoreductase n=1 Tax=Amycolatopsis nigrescens TaxID=381445 RepID=UPI00037B74DD|nr:SDR family oxidoreductase [Amycolatopsis nigrescens]